MLILFLISVYIKCITTARILGIVPTPSYSHQVVFRPIWAELSLRGHEVVVITTDPMNNLSLTNLTEIDLHSAYDIWIKHDIANYMAVNQFNFGNLIDKMINTMSDLAHNQMNHPKVQELLNIGNNTFDIVLAELMFPTMCAFSKLYNCPCIGIASMDISGVVFHNLLGNSAHPSLHPDPMVPFHGKLSFMERLGSTIMYLFTQYLKLVYTETSDEFLKKYFGQHVVSIDTLMNDMDLVFVNVNPVLNPVRPVTPATILFGGGTHITVPKPLPQVYVQGVSPKN